MQLTNLYMIKLGERNVFGMWDLQTAEKMAKEISDNHPNLDNEITIETVSIEDPATYIKSILLNAKVTEEMLNKVCLVSPVAEAICALYKIAPLSFMEWANQVLNNKVPISYQLDGSLGNIKTSLWQDLIKQIKE